MATIPIYRWRLAPDGLATRRQLRARGLRPGGQDVAAQLERPRRRRGPLVAYLYSIEQAKPVRPMTPAKWAALAKAQRRPAYLPRVPAGCRLRRPALARHVRALRVLRRRTARRISPVGRPGRSPPTALAGPYSREGVLTA
ncbi:hypothetical protein GCM10010270_13900 [Streptomyces violaceus]|nr:hypothetical protein GCM10010270_13900 [Streptomyces janthinus]